MQRLTQFQTMAVGKPATVTVEMADNGLLEVYVSCSQELTPEEHGILQEEGFRRANSAIKPKILLG